MRCKELCILPQVKKNNQKTSENVGNSAGQHALAVVPYAYSMLNYASLLGTLGWPLAKPKQHSNQYALNACQLPWRRGVAILQLGCLLAHLIILILHLPFKVYIFFFSFLFLLFVSFNVLLSFIILVGLSLSIQHLQAHSTG